MNLNELLTTLQQVTERNNKRLDDLEEQAERIIDRQANMILQQAATIDKLNTAVFLLTRELIARDRARAHFSLN